MAWLRLVLANRDTYHVKVAVWKLLRYDHRLQVADPLTQQEAAEFVAWKQCLSVDALSLPTWVKAFLEMASVAASRADDTAAAAATKRYIEWVDNGPAAGLKRLHLMSRTAVGWIPDKCDVQEEVNLSELDDLEGLSQEQLRTAIGYSPGTATPLATQCAANSERIAWGPSGQCARLMMSYRGPTKWSSPIPCR